MWTDEDIKYICENYESGKMSGIDLGKKYHVSKKRIYSLLRAQGVTVARKKRYRKHSLIETYFDEIDTQNKAYFLGFLFADGCNFTNSGSISMELSIHDIDILRAFKEEWGYSGDVTITNREGKQYGLLRVHSKYMSQRLSDLGMVKAKSHVLKYPTYLNPFYQKHFIRGYFDGNGTINYCKTQNFYTFSIICGTPAFIDSMKVEFEKLLCTKFTFGVARDGKCKKLNAYRKSFIHLIMKFLYEEAELYLSRKYNKFLEFERWK
uniref:DOD-type homing endonuclease domain-containing protein n=1 Tax=Pithovirus LCPAC304 TaxID=2506594 RepID=A0A481Z7Z9_9VIRU|nr:MAG: hypothetical protein LCPAC304_00620 [Pithovirus LCPAC304]